MWKSFSCLETDVNCKIVLKCGQSFRWKEDPKVPNTWYNVLNGKIWYLKQESDKIFYKTHSDKPDNCNTYKTKSGQVLSCKVEDDELFLRDYFQLDVDIPKLYNKWGQADKNFSQLKTNFCGIRMLRQDPVENLFSFICSQNNNIKRISQLVDKLCENYGNVIAECDGITHYSFPTLQSLAVSGVEEKLRKLGFGYRAKFIHGSAKCIETDHGGEEWLHKLREKSYEEAHQELVSLPGVGAKVADCVCLMSMDKTEAIPIDTHMWQIALRDYLPHLKKNKTVTDKAYKEIGDFFREMYGDYAGWAHTVLFSADLKRFEDLKNTNSKEPKEKTVKSKGNESKTSNKKESKANESKANKSNVKADKNKRKIKPSTTKNAKKKKV